MLGLIGRRSGPLAGCLVAGIAFVVAGCGTDVPALMKRDGDLFWEANFLLEEAAEAQVEVDPALYRAEADKITACDFLTEAMTEQIHEGEPDFVDNVLLGAGDLLARILPIADIEHCASAVDTYGSELDRLRYRLGLRMTAEEPAR